MIDFTLKWNIGDLVEITPYALTLLCGVHPVQCKAPTPLTVIGIGKHLLDDKVQTVLVCDATGTCFGLYWSSASFQKWSGK